MKRPERIAALESGLKSAGVLRLKQAADLLGVSEMTVRRDVATRPDAFSYLGGHILPTSGDRNPTYRLDAEIDAHAEAKGAAGKLAAAMVVADDTIFIDCGTTTPHIVPHLPLRGTITVICYALNVANLLVARPNVRLILLGGLFHPSSETFSSEEGLRSIERLGINRAFISAGGVHAQHGLSCSNFHEVPIKQAAMRRALHRTLVVDASKLGQVKPAFFGTLDQFDTIVTETGVGPAAASFQAAR
jgi:DeoR family deoxyribose operon repressor